jgi:hypothetical protein
MRCSSACSGSGALLLVFYVKSRGLYWCCDYNYLATSSYTCISCLPTFLYFISGVVGRSNIVSHSHVSPGRLRVIYCNYSSVRKLFARMLLSISTLFLIAIPIYWAYSNISSLRRNIAAAKRSGLPYVVTRQSSTRVESLALLILSQLSPCTIHFGYSPIAK